MNVQAGGLKPGKRVEAFDAREAISAIQRVLADRSSSWDRSKLSHDELDLRDLSYKDVTEEAYFQALVVHSSVRDLAGTYNAKVDSLLSGCLQSILDGLLPPWRNSSKTARVLTALESKLQKVGDSVFKKLHPLQLEKKLDAAYLLGKKVGHAGDGRPVQPGTYLSFDAYTKWHNAVREAYGLFCDKLIVGIEKLGEFVLSFFQAGLRPLSGAESYPDRLVVKTAMNQRVLARFFESSKGAWKYNAPPEFTVTHGTYGERGVYALIRYTPGFTKELFAAAKADFLKKAEQIAKQKGIARTEFKAGFPTSYTGYETQAFWCVPK